MPLKNSKFSLIKTTIITVFWLTIVIIVLSMYGLIFFPNFRTMLIYQLAKPKVLKPIDSKATLPVRIIKSAQLIWRPYFCLMGHNRRRALSRLTLSGQLLSGAKRIVPEPAPPRPSPVR